MTTPYDYRVERVRKYFIPTPAKPDLRSVGSQRTLGLVGVGIALLGLILLLTGSSILFGLLLLAGGGFGSVHFLREYWDNQAWNRDAQKQYERRYAAATPKATEAEMDAWLAESLHAITGEGLRRLNLDRHQLIQLNHMPEDHLTLLGMPPHTDRVYVAQGSNNMLRCSAYEVAIIYLTKWKLCVLQCELDMATGSFTGESIHEFLYKDINTLSTSSNRISLPDTAPGVPAQSLPLPASPDGHRILNAPATPETPTPPVWHITTKQELRFGVAGDHVSMAIGIHSRETVGLSAVGQPPNSVDATLNALRHMLHEYGSRGPGGIGSTDHPRDPFSPGPS